MLVKIGKYTGFCVYRRSYQVFTVVLRNRERRARTREREVAEEKAREEKNLKESKADEKAED